ncbi:hypothetical protein Calkro_1762 [Caldicellulosiruptor kronotskyensis 2002]|uniref:Uncharacterized protein n=1 Tax=Caldicellulosiruptor kronotskyensis (strain DSM 18902 / VKM B-2412 / 2002) TaxID=632348 RepID=E4SFT6_CALK2|nr:hypothetical protein Calkro_1762 [Caldicellulosiruptor kronotskyensis 2002]
MLLKSNLDSCLQRRGQLFVCEKTRENLRNLEILKERGS